MDASNISNSLNHVALLWNVRVLWLVVLDLFSILIRAGKHWLSGAPMKTFFAWKVLLKGTLVYASVCCWHSPFYVIFKRE